MKALVIALVSAAALAAAVPAAQAQDLRSGGKLLLTGGVSTIEGAAGGGLSTWAVIAGHETADGIGLAVHGTGVRTGKFQLDTEGAAVGFFDRLELSYARQRFDTRDVGAALGLGEGYAFHQDIFGAKLRVLGDLVYDQDRLTPQVAVGFQYKSNDRDAIVKLVGAKRSSDVEPYISATKLFLAQGVLVSGTVRATRANQFGILGFGGDKSDAYSAQFEGSAAWLASRRLVFGVEGRSKPDRLSFAKEDAAYDVFAAFAFAKWLSLTAAYVDLGSVAGQKNQRGAYLSLQTGF
jgi:hypothetical protein